MAKSLRQTTMKVKIDVDGKGLDVADKKIKETANEAENLEKASKKTGKAVEDTGKSLKEIARSASESTNSLKKQSSSTNDAAKSTDKLTDSSKALKDVLSTIGAAAVAKEMYELGKAVIQTGMEFDQGMSAVKAVSGASTKDFEAMRKQAIQLGSDTTKSAKEVSEGQLELAKSGMSAKQAMAAIPGVIYASAASGEEMAVATSVMTSALNGFSLKASESAHVADVLAMAANKSKADINDMGYAFKYAAAPANTLGMSLEEVSAATMVMVDSGMAGEQAGTSLRSALISLASPSKEASKEMDNLGLKITDAKGNMRPFSKIIDDLKKSTKDMGNAQKLAAISTIFGTEAASGLVKIIDSAPGTLNKYTEALKHSDGEAKKAYHTMNDNLSGSIKNLEGTFESIKISVSDVLTPSIRKGVDTLADLGEGFNNLTPSAKSMVVWGTVIVGGVIPASVAIYKVHKAVKSVREVMGGAKVFFNNYRREMQLTGAQAATTARQIQTMNIALNDGGTNRKGRKGKTGGTIVVPTDKNGLGKVNPKTGTLNNTLNSSAKISKKIPIVGTAIGVGALALGGKENLGSNLGSLGGGAAGAAIGSAIAPGIGTAIGGIAGAYFGESFGASIQKSLKNGVVSESVSSGTASAVKEYEKLNNKATEQLDLLYYHSGKISSKTAKSLKNTYSKMASSIEKSMESKFGKSTKTLKSFMENSDLSEKQQKLILKNMSTNHKAREDLVKKSEKRINSILKKATKEKRNLTAHERQVINKEQDKMKKYAVKTLSKSAKEQRTIMSELQHNSSRLSAKQAADVVKNSKKAKDGAVKEANKKYKDVVAAADAEFYDNHSISKKQHDAIIKKAKETRDKSIDHAEDMHEKVVSQTKKQAKGQVDQVNWSTGEMLTKWDKFKGGLAKVVNSISSGINNIIDSFGISAKIPTWNPNGTSKSTPSATKSKVVNNQGNSIASFARGGQHTGGPAVVGEEGPELAYTPYGNARLVGQSGAEIANLEPGTRILTARQTREMMNGGLKGSMPGYAKGIGGDLKDAAQAVGKGAKKTYKSAKSIVTSAYDFISDPSSAIDKIISKSSLKDMMGIGTAALSKVKDAAVNYLMDKLPSFGSAGGGTISNKYGVYDSLFSIAKTIMNSPLGKGLVITSGHREGDTYDHGKHNAIDLSGFGSNGGYKAVARWASKLPGVSYTIGDNTVFGKKYGDGSKPGWATGHMNHLHVSGMDGAVASGGSAKSWASMIKQAATQMKVKLSGSEMNGIIAQINRESSGNQGIVQSSAVNDINMRNGNPARGLLQYIPSTFANYAVNGHSNIMSGYDQLLAFFNNSNWRRDLPYGRSGWGPSGKRRFASGGFKNVNGQVLVGEEGPELVDLPFGSHVNNNRKTNELLNSKGQVVINFNPSIQVTVESKSDTTETAIERAVNKALEATFKDLRGIFNSGVAY